MEDLVLAEVEQVILLVVAAVVIQVAAGEVKTAMAVAVAVEVM